MALPNPAVTKIDDCSIIKLIVMSQSKSSKKPTAKKTTKKPAAKKVAAKKVTAKKTATKKVAVKKTVARSAKKAAIKSAPKKGATPSITQEAINTRAYYLAEARKKNKSHGTPEGDWHEALRQLQAESK